MLKEVAKKILPWVNKHKEDYSSVYVESRLDILRKQIEMSNDTVEIYRLQGQIKEVKRLLTLRDEVEKALNER